MSFEETFLVVALVLLVVSIVVDYFIDRWIRIKDACYRLEKSMHLKNYERNKIAKGFMGVLRWVSKY